MIYNICVIKNIDIIPHSVLGTVLAPNEEYTVSDSNRIAVASNDNILQNISAGKLQVGDSVKYFTSTNDQLNWLKNFGNLSKPTPFASKILEDGKKLFAREQGIAGVSIGAGATVAITFTMPYIQAKIAGAQILGCELGDTVNFKILDTSAGLITGYPFYPLNQFGFSVNMPDGEYKKAYNYDADLYAGMVVSIEYTNNGASAKTLYANIDLHEVKD